MDRRTGSVPVECKCTIFFLFFLLLISGCFVLPCHFFYLDQLTLHSSGSYSPLIPCVNACPTFGHSTEIIQQLSNNFRHSSLDRKKTNQFAHVIILRKKRVIDPRTPTKDLSWYRVSTPYHSCVYIAAELFIQSTGIE